MHSKIEELNRCETKRIKEFEGLYDEYISNCYEAKEDFISSIRHIGYNSASAAFSDVKAELFSMIENDRGKTDSSKIQACYENVSRKNLGENCPDHICTTSDAEDGYRFSKAKKNPGFISINDIISTYLPVGFSNFKIEGRGLGSAVNLEFLLYYLTKPEYQLNVREEIYLDGMLDLF